MVNRLINTNFLWEALSEPIKAATQNTVHKVNVYASYLRTAYDLFRVSSYWFDTVNLTPEEIAEHSLLSHKTVMPFADDVEMALRIGINFIGPELISCQRLNGLPLSVNLKVWEWVLEDIHSSIDKSCYDNIYTMLEGTSEIVKQLSAFTDDIELLGSISPCDLEDKLQEISAKYMLKVAHLQKDQSLFFCGGWLNYGGGGSHALIYEFRKIDDANYDVILYTSTGYIFANLVNVLEKDRQKPMVIYHAVPPEVLFFYDKGDDSAIPNFIQSFIELNLLAIRNSSKTYSCEDVEELFDFLEPFRVNVALAECGGITSQRGQNCPVEVFKACIRQFIGDLNLFKQLIFRAKLKISIAVFQALKPILESKSENGALARNLLVYASRNLQKRIDKMIPAGLVYPLLTKQAAATAQDIILSVAEYESHLIEQSKSDCLDMGLVESLPKPLKVSRGSILKDNTAWKCPNVVLLDLSITLGSSPQEAIKQTIQIVKERIACQQLLVGRLQIHHLVDQLPLPTLKGSENNYWVSLTIQEWAVCLEQIEELTILYLKCDSDLLPRHFATILPLHALALFLAVLIDEEKAKGLPDFPEARLSSYSFPFMHEVIGLNGVVFLSQREFDRTHSSMHYLKAFNLRNPAKRLFENEKSVIVKKTKIFHYSQSGIKIRFLNGKFWEWLLKRDKELKKAITELTKDHWPDLTDTQISQDYQKETEVYRAKADVNLPSPKFKVNLPGITKQVMLLESLAAKHAQQPTYEHIQILRRMLHISQWTLIKRKKAADKLIGPSNTLTHRENPYSHRGIISKDKIEVPPFSFDKKDKKTTNRLHGLMGDEHLNLLSKLPETTRNIANWELSIAEGKALELQASDKYELEHRLLRTLSQRELSPHQMIYEIAQEGGFDKLVRSSFQHFFFYLFLRSTFDEQSSHFGVGKIIVNDNALINNARTFMIQGLAYFFNHKNGVNGARFIFQLSFYLAKYLYDAKQVDQSVYVNLLVEVNVWLAKDDLNEQQRAVLHYYRVLLLLVHPQKEKYVADLCASWILFQLNPITENKWKSPVTLEFAKCQMVKFTATLDRTDLATLGSQIAAQLTKVSISKDSTWEVDKELGFPYLSNGTWKIELVSGLLYAEEGLISGLQADTNWENNILFGNLFGFKPKLSYFSHGEFVHFEHPTYGKFRLKSNKYLYLQHWFTHGGAWYEQEYSSLLPPALQKDYLFWDNPNQPHSYITSIHDHKIRFCVIDGVILEADSITGQPIADAHTISELTLHGCHLSNFELSGHILCFSDSQGKLKKILFSRYTSLDGNPLSFVKKGNDFVWSEDVTYKMPDKIPSNCLKGLVNYLYLCPIKGSGPAKLLVPFQELIIKNYITHELNIHNAEPLFEDGSSRKQEGRYRYFSYNIEGDRIIPTSLEGKLFLAYLYLAQRRHEDAIVIVRDIKPAERLSVIGFKIIELIISLWLSDSQPEARMVKLHAFALMVDQRDRQALAPITEYFSKENNFALASLIVAATDVKNATHNISRSCHIEEPTIEIHLLEILLKEGTKREDELEPLLKNTKSYLNQIERYLTHKEMTNSNNIDVLFYTRNHDRKFGYGDKSGDLPKHQCIFTLPEKIEGQSSDEALQQLYQANLEKALEWLGKGKLSRLVTAPPDDMDLPNNGLFFQHVYQIAKNGTEIERNATLFKLLSWRLHTYPPEEILDLMIKVTLAPIWFPPFFPNHASLEEKRDFLQRLNEIYGQVDVDPKMRSFVQQYKAKIGRPIIVNKFPLPTQPGYYKRMDSEESFIQKPFSISFQFNEMRWQHLKTWKSYLLLEPISSAASHGFSLEWEDSLLSCHEAIHKESLKNDFSVLLQDYDVGRKLIENREIWMIPDHHCSQLIENVLTRLIKVTKSKNIKEFELLRQVNKVTESDQLKSQSRNARINGLLDSPVTLEECVEGLLSGNFNVAKSVQVDGIAALTLEIEDLKSEEHQLKRILQLINDIRNIENPQDVTRRSLCQKLAAELDSSYHFADFSEREQIVLRVMAGETGLLPFKKQTEVIKKLIAKGPEGSSNFKDVVIQLMPGMGKSTLIATLILYLAAQQNDALSLFLVPDFLLDSIKFNLSEGMAKAFHKNIHVLDVERKDLTLHRIKQILNLLNLAKAKKEPILSIPSTLQCFELEFLSRAKKFRKLFNEVRTKRNEINEIREKIDLHDRQIGYLRCNSPEHKQKEAILKSLENNVQRLEKMKSSLRKHLEEQKEHLIGLAEILKMTSKNAIALMDEVDLLLDCLQEVNFPEGERIRIDPTYNQLMYEIYLAIVNENVLVATLPGKPAITQIVRLNENKQDLMSSDIYLQHVVPCIALYLSEHFKLISDHVEDYQQSFVRYVSGQMPAELEFFISEGKEFSQQDYEKFTNFESHEWSQLYNDLEFLKYLRKLSEGEHKSLKAVADLIAQTKHFLSDVLKSTLSKTGGKDYIISSAGKIILLQTRDTPSNRDCGYHWEEAAYSYQYAAAFAAGSELILAMAKMTEQAARHYMVKNGEAPDENIEYREFKRLTGIAVTEVREPEKLAEAVGYLAKNVAKRLEIQSEFIHQNVTYFSERLTSNSMDLLKLSLTNLGMSGNPWNVKGYLQSLAESYVSDSGTEGQILHTLAMRSEGKNKIYEVDFKTIHEFMEQIYAKHPLIHKESVVLSM